MPVCELSCDVDDATFYAQSNDPNFDIDAHSDKVNELGKNSIESPVEPFSKAKLYLKNSEFLLRLDIQEGLIYHI